MRLGAYPCVIKPGTKAAEAYGTAEISERHRHRYEFNKAYAAAFEDAGMSAQPSRTDIPIGVVVVTHTDYGTRLLAAAECILGPQECCQAVSVDMTQEVAQTLVGLKKAIKDTDRGAGVLILTDMSLAIPAGVHIEFVQVAGLVPYLAKTPLESDDALVLFSNCHDAQRAYVGGFGFPVLNLGNLHYAPGKKQICPHGAQAARQSR